MIFAVLTNLKSGIKPAPACHRPYCTVVVCFEQHLKDQRCDNCYNKDTVSYRKAIWMFLTLVPGLNYKSCAARGGTFLWKCKQQLGAVGRCPQVGIFHSPSDGV